MLPISLSSFAAALSLFFAVTAAGQGLKPFPEEDPAGSALIAAAQKQVRAYHDGEPEADNKIRLVYFHPADRGPLDDWQPRLQRAMDDISGFYRDGLQRFGVGDKGLPFEQDESGKFKFHVVTGAKPASEYHHKSGNPIFGEIRKALPGIQFDREHALVLHGLCSEVPDEKGAEGDIKFVFDAPYYGRGNQANGLCHAADCRLLDPQFLTAKDRKIVYKEHYYERKEQTLALFNSWYLGGIAHELGHGIALPHNNGTPEEKTWAATSLMGRGNHTYRNDRWGGKRPSFLSRSCALRLISSPLMTCSNKGRFDQVESALEGLQLSFDSEKSELALSGSIESSIPGYAAIVYVWPDGQSDHGATTMPGLVSAGKFRLAGSANLRPGEYQIRVAVLHVNGAATNQKLSLSVGREGVPDTGKFNGGLGLPPIEQAIRKGERDRARQLLAASPAPDSSGELAARLTVLQEILDPPAPRPLSEIEEDSAFLSDVAWKSAEIGWGEAARNHYHFEGQGDPQLYLKLDGQIYAKGLYAHSESTYTFALGGKWKKLTATVGLRDGAASQGSAHFSVLGDGKLLSLSKPLREGQKESLSVDLTGVETLTLHTKGAEGHNHNSWAIWVDPILTR